MYLDDKRVFIAGATGSVGTAVIKHFLGNYPGMKITASYRKTAPLITDKRIRYVKADLRMQDQCRKAVKGCDCAVMAAANSFGAGSSISQPHMQVNDNLFINARLLEAFHAENVKRAVYVGSATVYQEFEGSIKEDQLDLNKDPHPAYFGVAWVVRYLEKLCWFWHERYGLEIVIARASNVFGPYSKFDPQNATFIPAIIRKAVAKMDPFEVWGRPEVIRDVVYSEDFARAIDAMLNNTNIKFDTFNIGSGQKTAVADVVKWALDSAGHAPSTIKYLDNMPTTVKYRAIDTSKASKVLDWKPKYTVEEGIDLTTRWWKENKRTWKK
jgi:nucleoside-diphosphate-sugar epimerase